MADFTKVSNQTILSIYGWNKKGEHLGGFKMAVRVHKDVPTHRAALSAVREVFDDPDTWIDTLAVVENADTSLFIQGRFDLSVQLYTREEAKKPAPQYGTKVKLDTDALVRAREDWEEFLAA